MDIKRKRKQIFDLYPSELLRRIVKTEKAFMQTYGRTLFFSFLDRNEKKKKNNICFFHICY